MSSDTPFWEAFCQRHKEAKEHERLRRQHQARSAVSFLDKALRDARDKGYVPGYFDIKPPGMKKNSRQDIVEIIECIAADDTAYRVPMEAMQPVCESEDPRDPDVWLIRFIVTK